MQGRGKSNVLISHSFRNQLESRFLKAGFIERDRGERERGKNEKQAIFKGCLQHYLTVVLRVFVSKWHSFIPSGC